MAEKLAESTWTSFTKKQKLELDDGPLVKALAKFDKTEESKPEPRLAALEDIVEQVKKQVALLVKRKKELGDKPFNEAKDKLYVLLDLAESAQKDTRDAAAHAEEDEEDTPALLTTALAPLLRQVQKGEVTMHALVAVAGARAAVLVMRRPISTSRRKLLAEYLGETAKYYSGQCAGASKEIHFLIENSPGGLSKKLRAALFDQTGLRVKVMVQTAGSDEMEEDGEAAENEADETEGEGDAPEGGPGTTPPGTVPPAPPGGPASAEQLSYVQRLRKIREPLEQALRNQHPEATKLRALMGFASEKADAQHDYAAATKALQQLEALLAATGPAGDVKVDEGVAFNTRLAALLPKVKAAADAAAPGAQDIKLKASEAGLLARKREFDAAHKLLDEVEALLAHAPDTAPGPSPGKDQNTGGGGSDALAAWQTERAAAVATLKAVAGEIAGAKHASSAKALIEINAVMKNLTAAPTTVNQVAELERYLGQDDVVHDVCELSRDIRTPLLRALGKLKAQLGA